MAQANNRSAHRNGGTRAKPSTSQGAGSRTAKSQASSPKPSGTGGARTGGARTGGQGASRINLYDEITARIICQLEEGRVPWVQPWGNVEALAPGLPRNALSRRYYSGINILILWGAVIEQGFPCQSWITFKQALQAGGNVRKGETGITIVYADRFVPESEKARAEVDGSEARSVPFLKRSTVFNGAP